MRSLVKKNVVYVYVFSFCRWILLQFLSIDRMLIQASFNIYLAARARVLFVEVKKSEITLIVFI